MIGGSLTRLREQLETRKNTPACELRSVYDVADAAQNIVDHLECVIRFFFFFFFCFFCDSMFLMVFCGCDSNLQTVLGEFSAALMDGDQVAIATAVRIGDNLARCR
eukprot:SAG31_NODE_8284_length_1480_cov_33.762491_2_plen_106_part_00